MRFVTRVPGSPWIVHEAERSGDGSNSRLVKLVLASKGQSLLVASGVPYGLSDLVRFIEATEKELTRSTSSVQNRKGCVEEGVALF